VQGEEKWEASCSELFLTPSASCRLGIWIDDGIGNDAPTKRRNGCAVFSPTSEENVPVNAWQFTKPAGGW
jgi:hypothetical protein